MARAVYSARSVRTLEQRAQRELGLDGYTLMQRAASALAEALQAMRVERPLRGIGRRLCEGVVQGGPGGGRGVHGAISSALFGRGSPYFKTLAGRFRDRTVAPDHPPSLDILGVSAARRRVFPSCTARGR